MGAQETWQPIPPGKVHLVQFVEGLIDEDEGDEESKDFLGEGRDVAHQEASLSCHDNEDEDDEPQTNPHSACQILNALCLAELKWKGQRVTHTSSGCLPHLLPIKITVSWKKASSSAQATNTETANSRLDSQVKLQTFH